MPGLIDLMTTYPHFSACYVLLGLAITSLWFKQGKQLIWWTLLLLASLVIGHHFSILSDKALLLAGTLWFTCYLTFYVKSPAIRVLSRFVLIVLVCLLLLNYFSGFLPWLPVINSTMGNRAIPFTHSIHYEYGLLGLCILGMRAMPLIRHRPEWSVMIRDSMPIALAGCLAMACIIYADPGVSMAFGWNSYVKYWMVGQTLFVCIADEAVFRGMIQGPLSHLLDRWSIYRFPIGIWLALLLTTAFYMLRYAYAGYHVMLYSTIAGLFYGYAYLKTRRIEASIFVHVFLTTFDLVVFSYPMLN